MFVKNVPQIATYTSKGILKPDNETTEVDENGVLGLVKPPQVVAWTSGSDDEIEAMINGYYDGKLSLEDVKSVWSVGDIRQANETDKVKMQVAGHYTSRQYGGNDQSQTHQLPTMVTIKQTILDFNHDNLKTVINNITKALITIQTTGTIDDTVSGASNHGMGMNNNSDTNTGGQADCSLRIYTNGTFYNALGFKSWIKQVVKQNCVGYQSSEITTTDDYCFLCSEYEIFGNHNYNQGNEGTQYKYFETSSNRRKYTGYEATGSSCNQQERSIYSQDFSSFCFINTSGESRADSPYSNYKCIVITCAL